MKIEIKSQSRRGGELAPRVRQCGITAGYDRFFGLFRR